MRKEYEPGTLIRRGNMTYQADYWGILRPLSQNKEYQAANKNRMARMIDLEQSETWAFREKVEMERQDRAIRENLIKVVA